MTSPRPRSTDGTKVIETRAYPLPAPLLHRRIEIVETSAGTEGVSLLPDTVPAAHPGASVVGSITFGACFQARTEVT